MKKNKKDDIDRRALEHLSSGMMPEKKNHPDKAYDPMKMLRHRLADNNDKNAPKPAQTEDVAVKQEHNYPGDKKDRYKQIRKFLSKKKMT